ncbi:HlyD family secretion protein [Virgibacillus natechei]|uniref:HlyD family secretion protein n=1 Tax=Virgibacillus natechei TaxID=1216297 RepID=A0ABS4ILL7_9BACI|nr:HlyD family efflux transporter periplasmic adaptor subunit [Virgibacillus natechei]MBP1970899.1 HlyD family secretion protein [Virgibacillus natechei]UZD13282.1 HlyD family efflux transporter periplasmic adaptor subunit [Virgibacillus natechei]
MIRRRLIQALAVVFIGVNFLLVYVDDGENVERTSYITNWSHVFESDMLEQLHKPGVLAYAEEEHIYFDQNVGSFQEFLVEEGAQVNAGDGLYVYQVNDYVEVEANLMREVEALNGEISAVEEAIAQMDSYQIQDISPSTLDPFGFDEELPPLDEGEMLDPAETADERDERDEPEEAVEAELMKEQYIIEKEKELAQKTAQLNSVEGQLTELQSGGDTVTVVSPFQGTIKAVKETLEDPVITIEGTALHAEGELTEQERTQVEPGQEVEVRLTEQEMVMEGEVNEISESPIEVQIEGESIYPFTVAFNEMDEEVDQEDLLPGYHANVSIVMEESLGATVLFEDHVFTDSVWKMNADGKLVEQRVETGILMDTMLEITNGVTMGDTVAEEPTAQFRNGASFITPLKRSGISWDNITSYEHWSKAMVSGFLSR